MSWPNLRAAIKTWLIEVMPSLPEGWSKPNIEGVPFPINLMKDSTRPHGLYLARSTSDDDTFSMRLDEQLNDKADKLKQYRAAGCLTMLLLESCDLVLMSNGK